MQATPVQTDGTVFLATAQGARKLVVRHNEFGEFEVPTRFVDGKSTALYFASDKQDAIDTARYIFGEAVVLTFRRGSYQPGVV